MALSLPAEIKRVAEKTRGLMQVCVRLQTARAHVYIHVRARLARDTRAWLPGCTQRVACPLRGAPWSHAKFQRCMVRRPSLLHEACRAVPRRRDCTARAAAARVAPMPVRRPVVRRTAWLPARRLSSTARQEKRKLEELAQQQAEEIDMLRLELKGRDTVR